MFESDYCISLFSMNEMYNSLKTFRDNMTLIVVVYKYLKPILSATTLEGKVRLYIL